MGLEVLLQKQLILNYQSKIIFGCCMRKESQHCQILDNYLPNITHQCQETTKKFTRLNQIKSKNDFLDWLRSLPFQIRYLAVKVEAPGLAQTTRQALRRLEFKNDSIDQKKLTYKLQKNILDAIVFTSDGRQFFDSICFDFSYIEYPEKLYDLLMYSGENVKKFNPIEDMEKNRKPISESCQEISYLKSKQQLCKTLVRILRHEVFFNTCHKQEIQINDQKNRKKQLSFYWKNLTEEMKHSILYLKKQGLKELFAFLTDQKIAVSLEQLQKEIPHLLKLQKNQFCNKIFKCKLKKSLTGLTDYHEQIYNMWKLDYEKSKRRKNKRISNFTVTKNQEFYLLKEQKYQNGIMKSKPNIFVQKENSIDSFQTNETEIYEKLEETIIKKSFFKESFLNYFIQKKIFKNISQFSNHISKEANVFHKARLIAFERIKFILECYGVPIKIFGSCASGIAIKNSDIDIAIDNSILNYFSYCEDENKVKFALQWLQSVFSGFQCMKNIKFIKNASIPIIKLTLDTSESFQVDPSFFSFDISPFLKNLNRPHTSCQIQVDITVETHSQNFKCNHMGINTTKRINQWMQEVKPLKYIVIIMKYFLNLEELNSTYKEGINTYGIVVMFMAAIKHLKLQKEQNIVLVFQKIIKFYIYQFDEKLYGIDLRNKKDIFYRKSTPPKLNEHQLTKADLQILDPENDGKNMTKKCYKYNLVKDLFQVIEKKCFEEQRRNIISSFLKDKKLSFANIQNQNHLKKESLQEIANNMQNPFMLLLKQHQGTIEGRIKTQYEKNQSFQDNLHQNYLEGVEGFELLKTQSITG